MGLGMDFIRAKHLIILFVWLGAGWGLPGASAQEARRVHVFVALADNEHQGIAKVPAKIGDGDDADANLYWGCTDGLNSVFGRSKVWRLEKTELKPTSEILERRTYRHVTRDCLLVAEAWRGRCIQECLGAFFASVREKKATLSAFIGHNGLMEVPGKVPLIAEDAPVSDALVLCCVSRLFFEPHLKALRARPVLMTEQLMYPGAFLLRDALEVWLRGGSRTEVRLAAARAYAVNQRISVKAASSVFSKLD